MACSTNFKNPLLKKQLPTGRITKPTWLKIKVPRPSARYLNIKEIALKNNLATVCGSAMCPNISECWGSGTATFMIMGDTCTRACRFCSVKHGKPEPLDKMEPKKLANSVHKLGINYAVITTVDRDDLTDFGASHFVKCIKELKKKCPRLIIEILTGDFRGNKRNIKKVVSARPNVFAHNLETVRSLTKYARDFRASYDRSLQVLKYAKLAAKKINPSMKTKSSLMVGIGEKPDEIKQTMIDLRKIDVDFLTIGQYLQPTAWNIPVKEYVTPAQFEIYRKMAISLGFKGVASGPFVRSSYRAFELISKSDKTAI